MQAKKQGKESVEEADIAPTSGIDTKGAGLGAGRSETTLEGRKMKKETTNTRDTRAEKAGKKVTKDIEYDEKKKKKKAVKEGLSERVRAARHEGKAHGLKGHAYCGTNYEDMEECRAYHKGYKEGLDECYGMKPILGLGRRIPSTMHGMDDQALDETYMSEDMDDDAYEFEGIANEIADLTHQALDLIPRERYEIRERAKSYWFGQILSAVGADDYKHGSMHSMMATLEEMREDDEEDEVDEGILQNIRQGHGAAGPGRNFDGMTGKPLHATSHLQGMRARMGRPQQAGSSTSMVPTANKDLADEGNAFGYAAQHTPKGKHIKIHGHDTGEIRTEDSLDEYAFEAWDRQLENLINEGLSVSISKGNQNSPDSVNINATDDEADKLLALVKQAGLGVFGGEEGDFSMPNPHEMGGASEINSPGEIEVVGDHDKMLALMKKLSGVGGGHVDAGDEDDYADEEHGHEEACNECGMTECSCSPQKMDEVQSENQMEYEVAEDQAQNPPDNGSANSKNATADDQKANASAANFDQSQEKMEEGKEKCDECGMVECECDKEIEEGVHPYHKHEKHNMERSLTDAYSESKLDEWANNAGKKGTDASFERDIDFMTKVISGGLNKPKSTGQTTVPVVASQVKRLHSHETTSTDINESISYWIKLAGIK